jgi:predicted pyridoxine 5'-phosphate oxidase superfamily flavin-nucleotide-binding protein
MIGDFMPDEHRELFEKLPYLVVAAADDEGQLWATMLAGEPGLIQTPDERTMRVNARPVVGDPMRALLQHTHAADARAIAILGIELATRRRNRANGEVIATDARGFSVHVRQSFGNCPQYIQARRPIAVTARPGEDARAARPQGAHLDDEAVAIIRGADTFFLATATPSSLHSVAAGADVSHRGGRPGFVLVEQHAGGTRLLAPDYRGNFMFNTFGNLELNPRAGLMFVDFSTGTLLSLTGEAEVSWDDPRIAELPGAQRLLTVRVTSGVLLPGALPWRWSEPQLASQLA